MIDYVPLLKQEVEGGIFWSKLLVLSVGHRVLWIEFEEAELLGRWHLVCKYFLNLASSTTSLWSCPPVPCSQLKNDRNNCGSWGGGGRQQGSNQQMKLMFDVR
jgi:hypothetical protein